VTELHEFTPDWTLAPAALFAEWLEEATARTVRELVAGFDDPEWAEKMLREVSARQPLGPDHAAALAAATGTTVSFWLGAERRYRADLERGATEEPTGPMPAWWREDLQK
jgi:hypothetical protein